MNQNYYPVDFEAQYEETSQKMIEISKKFKEMILTKQPDTIDKIETDLEAIQGQIEDMGLQFHKQSIYSQFASGQLMAERRKQPPEMCPECGEELKRQVQCQFCAQLFCKKCCSRNRIIPFVSKDMRLCCEQCHWKFVKLFDNKQYYEEKEKLTNVINFVKNKTNKIVEKVVNKRAEVEEYRKQKLNQKIKEKNSQNKLLQEEKKLKQLEEDFRRVVSQKAEKIREEDRRRQIEEQQRKRQKEKQRIAELQRLKKQEEDKKKIQQQQIRRRQQQAMRQRELSWRENQQRQIERKKKEEKQILEKQILRKKDQQMRKKDQQIQQLKRLLQTRANQQKIRKNSGDSIRSRKQDKIVQTPKQSIENSNKKKQQLIDTAATKSNNQKRKGSEDIQPKNEPIQKSADATVANNLPPMKLLRTESTKEQKKPYVIEKPLQIKKTQAAIEKPLQIKKTQVQLEDGLDRSLANMFSKTKKDDDTKSIASNNSKAKSILDMSVNELLGARLHMPRSNSKIQNFQPKEPVLSVPIYKPAQQDNQQQKVQQEIVLVTPKKPVDRSSIKIQTMVQPQITQQQLKNSRNSIIRNSSLISSTNKDTKDPDIDLDAKKCTCEVM